MILDLIFELMFFFINATDIISDIDSQLHRLDLTLNNRL